LATDIRRLVENLRAFHDLRGLSILSVGAGGGQLVDLYAEAARVVAVDSDSAALVQLERAVDARGARDRYELVEGDFFDVAPRADITVFEFCLHEIEDPVKALGRARSLAPDVLVFDHAPGSEWAYYTVEEDKVARSTRAMEASGIRRRAAFRGEQRFPGYAELRDKVASQGPAALERIASFRDVSDIVIAMEYLAALL
jgi:hypothetical protein